MQKRTAIVITGVGSGVAQSIIKALKYAEMKHGRDYFLIGTDATWKAAGLYVLDKGYTVPYCHEPTYIPRIIEICNRDKVAFLLPGTDPEVVTIGNCREEIEEKSGVHVLVNPKRTIEIGYDKYKTSLFLKKQGLPYPHTICINSDRIDMGDIRYPFIVKPRFGSGSVGFGLIKNEQMLKNHLASHEEEMIAQEFIDAPDNEFTCGLSFNKDGSLLQTIILKRNLKKGFTQFAAVEQQKPVELRIREIAGVLEGRGSYNIQGRLVNGDFVVFEINPRFSGTTAFRAVLGLNEPDIYIQHCLTGKVPGDVKIRPLYMMRYLNECYVEPEAVEELQQGGCLERPMGFKVDYF